MLGRRTSSVSGGHRARYAMSWDRGGESERSEYLAVALRSQHLAIADFTALARLSETSSRRVQELEELSRLNAAHATSASGRLRDALARRSHSARNTWASPCPGAAISASSPQSARGVLPRSCGPGKACAWTAQQSDKAAKQDVTAPIEPPQCGAKARGSSAPSQGRKSDGGSPGSFIPSVGGIGSSKEPRSSCATQGLDSPMARQLTEDPEASWSSLGSDDSAARRQRHRSRANRWISETACQVGRVVGDEDLWKENHRRRVTEARHQAVVMKNLAKNSMPFTEFCEMRQKDMLENQSAAAVKLVRARELPCPDGNVFQGAVCNTCIASFPGMYLEDWRGLFEVLTPKKLASACVWLPQDAPTKRFGHHTLDPKNPGKCYCHKLYGQKRPWGCLWFKHWVKNIRRALQLGLTLLVVFLPNQVGREYLSWEGLAHQGDSLWNNVGLGGSQKGEVAWLKMQGIPYKSTDITDLHKALTPNPTPTFVAPDIIKKTMTGLLRQQEEEEASKQRTVSFAPKLLVGRRG